MNNIYLENLPLSIGKLPIFAAQLIISKFHINHQHTYIHRKTMKKTLLLFSCLITILSAIAQKPIVISKHKNYFSIVIADNKSVTESYAATELQSFLEKILGQRLEIVSDKSFKGAHAIVIGRNTLSEKLYRKYGQQLQHDGFLLHTDGKNLYLMGNDTAKSNLYAVYHLLENHFGCTYTCSNNIHYEALPDEITLNIHDLQNPAFRYRETLHLIPNADQRYADWHKLHNRDDFNRDWGLFVHTFRFLIPVERYFDEHPEWFSEIHGQRVRDGQLCLSNPEVFEELCKNLEQRINAEPEKSIWSVSQNDNESSCTCAQCRRLDSLYGGPSGTLIHFINRVAARFPDKTISTLAYQQTRRPPKNIRPAENVNIMFCSIECARQIPIADNPADQSFQQDMKGWTALTDDIILWDYVVQFRNYMDPFPNLHVLQPNLQNFHKHGIPMMFEQGSGHNVAENHECRVFLLAHLLWDVNADVEALRNRFLAAHYGENRATYVKQFQDVMRQALLDSKQVLSIYGYPINAKNGYLAPDKIEHYQSLFAAAYKALPTDDCTPEERQAYDDRLRLLELTLDFAILELSMSDLSPELSYFRTGADGRKEVRPEMIALADRFVSDCARLGVKRLDEAKYTPEQLRSNVESFIRKSTRQNISAGRHVTCATEWSNLYDVGGPKALTDGNFGIMNYNYNWLGFFGHDMDVIIDLDSVQPVSEISADFLFYPLCWIFAPQKVTCYLSDDQATWTEVGSRTYDNEESLTECKIVGFSFKELNQRGRYVRMKAESLLTNPAWHRGVGQPCWIFCDEVLVQ